MTPDDPMRDDTVTLDCELAAPPEKVWRALTVPALLARWLMPNDIRPQVGARFSFQPDSVGRGEHVECEVLAAEPNRRLTLRWRSEAASDGREPAVDSVVDFQLIPVADGRTRLRLVHSGLPAAMHPAFGGMLGARGLTMSMHGDRRRTRLHARRRSALSTLRTRRLPWAA